MKKRFLLILTFILISLFLASCGTNIRWREPGEDGRIKINSKKELEGLLIEPTFRKDGYYYDNAVPVPEAGLEDLTPPNQETVTTEQRDYVDTNNQVLGVDEGDIVKTDGFNIYYTPQSSGEVFQLEANSNGQLGLKNNLFFKDTHISNLFLTDSYLIVVGNKYSYYIGWDYYRIHLEDVYNEPKGFVNVYNKDTLELVYSFESQRNIYNYRLIDNTFFFTYHEASKIPTYEETINGETKKVELSYKDVYYFEGMEGRYITVYNLLDLDTFEMDSEGYIGYNTLFYVSKEAIYTTYTKYDYVNKNGEISDYQVSTFITKINISGKTLKFSSSGKVEGMIYDSYWMDEYNGHLRVISTSFNPVSNKLFILKENGFDLDIVSSITEGIGKPREQVKSVRFSGSKAFVVTFEQIDPLYTIDLSNELKPAIISDIEEEGYNTYLHVWDDENTKLIGLGFDADEFGRTTGLKMGAYDVNETDPLYTYYFDKDEGYSYTYAEAIYNPKALIISPKYNVIGMTVNKSYYGNGKYERDSSYYIFKIDFDAEKIISDPLIIKHENSNDYYYQIDRGVMIVINDNAYIYTLSRNLVKTYSLLDEEVIGVLILGGNKNHLVGVDELLREKN